MHLHRVACRDNKSDGDPGYKGYRRMLWIRFEDIGLDEVAICRVATNTDEQVESRASSIAMQVDRRTRRGVGRVSSLVIEMAF